MFCARKFCCRPHLLIARTRKEHNRLAPVRRSDCDAGGTEHVYVHPRDRVVVAQHHAHDAAARIDAADESVRCLSGVNDVGGEVDCNVLHT